MLSPEAKKSIPKAKSVIVAKYRTKTHLFIFVPPLPKYVQSRFPVLKPLLLPLSISSLKERVVNLSIACES
jgi:hypothetical protein